MWFSKKRVYLDSAAATPITNASAKAFAEALVLYGNPSAPHIEGKTARDLLEHARQMIATGLGVKKDAVIFTGTATEANALAILGYVRSFYASRNKEDIHILYSPISHASVIEAVELLEKEGCTVEALQFIENAIDLATLAKQLKKETVLVSLDAVCGETGTLFKTRDVRRVIDASKESHPLLHVDASQAPLVESIVLQHTGADLLTFDAQKIGAVRGVGVLIARRSIPLVPLYGGGGQERGLRSGTPSPALAYACAVALQEAEGNRDAFVKKSLFLKHNLLQGLQQVLPTVLINGGDITVPHILNVSCPGYDTDYLVAVLDQLGFAVSTKSACETNEIGSRVVLALSGDEARAASTLRISFARTTTQEDIRRFIKAFRKALMVVNGS